MKTYIVKFGKRSKRMVSIEEQTEGFVSATTSNTNLVTIHEVQVGDVLAEEFAAMANTVEAPKLTDTATAPDTNATYVYVDGTELKACA